MGKKKKNSNYVTAKTQQAKIDKENAKRAKRRKEILKLVLIPTVSVLLIAAIIVGLGFAFGWWRYKIKATHHASITIKDYGTVHLELDGNAAPETVANFVKLANEGFYDGLTFHRIIDGFMAQGGDPEGDGTGGSGKNIKGEFSENGVRNRIKHERGTISMARSDDPNSASSQFFIVHQTSESNSESLDGKYAAFGIVTGGMDIIDAIIADANPGYNGAIAAADQPIIESITIHAAHD